MPWYDGYNKILDVNWKQPVIKKGNTCIAILKVEKGAMWMQVKYDKYCGKHKNIVNYSASNKLK